MHVMVTKKGDNTKKTKSACILDHLVSIVRLFIHFFVFYCDVLLNAL